MTASVFHREQRDRQIRDSIRDLPERDRLPFVLRAIATGDRVTVNAVVHGPSYTSGLSDKEHAALTRLAATKAAVAAAEAAAEAAGID